MDADQPCAGERDGDLCSGIRFTFPNTDAYVGTPTDGYGLAGPVLIVRNWIRLARNGRTPG